jgi:hypothetical protein
MPDGALPLERWGNFYVITSTAAAALIGLLFVLITLAAERRRKELAKIRIYLTPTVVYFGSVFLLAALLTFPDHTRVTATLCCCIVGGIGLLYTASLLLSKGARKTRYNEVTDIAMYVACPAAAYALLVLGGVVLGDAPQRGLTFAAAGMLALIMLAVRNSWAIAVDVVSSPGRDVSPPSPR